MANIDKDRIAKYIAASGFCSRRDAEKLIIEGRVKVNNKVIDHPATFVDNDDEILIDNNLVSKRHIVPFLWIYHKPKNIVTTHNDEKNRTTLFSLLPKEIGRVLSVGRLDINSEGLILLTNDGSLQSYLESPKTGWTRTYRVRVFGKLPKEKLKNLATGITIDGIKYKPAHVIIEKEGNNSWLQISIIEGKNREIRKIMKYLGLEVSRLIRISYGPFDLGNLPSGQLKPIPKKIVQNIVKLAHNNQR